MIICEHQAELTNEFEALHAVRMCNDSADRDHCNYDIASHLILQIVL